MPFSQNPYAILYQSRLYILLRYSTFTISGHDFDAAFTRSNCWTNQSVQQVDPTVESTVASCEPPSNRLLQPVGRIKHIKFIPPVESTVASLKRSFNCRAEKLIIQMRSFNQPIQSLNDATKVKCCVTYLLIYLFTMALFMFLRALDLLLTSSQ